MYINKKKRKMIRIPPEIEGKRQKRAFFESAKTPNCQNSISSQTLDISFQERKNQRNDKNLPTSLWAYVFCFCETFDRVQVFPVVNKLFQRICQDPQSWRGVEIFDGDLSLKLLLFQQTPSRKVNKKVLRFAKFLYLKNISKISFEIKDVQFQNLQTLILLFKRSKKGKTKTKNQVQQLMMANHKTLEHIVFRNHSWSFKSVLHSCCLPLLTHFNGKITHDDELEAISDCCPALFHFTMRFETKNKISSKGWNQLTKLAFLEELTLESTNTQTNLTGLTPVLTSIRSLTISGFSKIDFLNLAVYKTEEIKRPLRRVCIEPTGFIRQNLAELPHLGLPETTHFSVFNVFNDMEVNDLAVSAIFLCCPKLKVLHLFELPLFTEVETFLYFGRVGFSYLSLSETQNERVFLWFLQDLRDRLPNHIAISCNRQSSSSGTRIYFKHHPVFLNPESKLKEWKHQKKRFEYPRRTNGEKIEINIPDFFHLNTILGSSSEKA